MVLESGRSTWLPPDLGPASRLAAAQPHPGDPSGFRSLRAVSPRWRFPQTSCALQFAIAGLVFRFVNSKEPEIVVKIWERENQQKKIMGDVLCVARRILC